MDFKDLENKHAIIMGEIQRTWERGKPAHYAATERAEGIRSTQVSALVMYLIEKGILK